MSERSESTTNTATIKATWQFKCDHNVPGYKRVKKVYQDKKGVFRCHYCDEEFKL